MDWFSILMVVLILAGAGTVTGILFSRRSGPPQCIGCGKCAADGICILTGKQVAPPREETGKTGEF